MSDTEARLRLAESENQRLNDKLFYARRSYKALTTRTKKAEDENRWLHGILLTHGIEPKGRPS